MITHTVVLNLKCGLLGTSVMVFLSYIYIVNNTFDHLSVAWAEKKRYFTAKASRLDTYRAGNTRNNIIHCNVLAILC